MARVVTSKRAGIIIFSVILFLITMIMWWDRGYNLREWTFSNSVTYKGFYFGRQDHILGNNASHLEVYLKPDEKNLTIRVMINCDKSSLKKNWDTLDLKHELYRANLAAVIARDLNEFIITGNSVSSYDEFLKLFKEYNLKFKQLDKQYRKETNFGANTAAQDYWEYKIDSMYYAHDKLNVKD